MVLALLYMLVINFVISLGKVEVALGPGPRADEHTYLDVYSSAINRAHYNPWTCNYFRDPGYKCISCKSALHCYPGNFALLVQCAGMFPFCRNGYCSRFKQDGCTANEGADAVPHNMEPVSAMPPYVQGSATPNKNKSDNISDVSETPLTDTIEPALGDMASQ